MKKEDMPVPSAEHLCEILCDLYENREKLEEVGKACYERATDTKYQWDTVAHQFEEVFAETLKETEAPRPKVRRRRKGGKKPEPVGMAN